MFDNNHIYTAEDIHRYFSGSMSADEMYAMDKAALNDPLLAEAMEGYHSLPSFANEAGYADIQKQLDELKNKLPGKVVSINKRNNSWWKVAAAVLLIGGSVFAFLKINSSKNKENAVVAKTDSLIKFHIPNDSAAVAINSSSSEKVVVSDSLNANAIASPSKGNKKAVTYIGSTTLASSSNVTTYQLADSTNMDLAKAENNGLINSSSVFYKKDTTKNAGTFANGDYYTTIDGNQKPKKNNEKLRRAFQQPASANFTGRIVDDNNNAVPYAKLMINNKKQAKTDINGYFNMALPDTSIRLDVAAYNYYPQTANVSANNFAGIILKAKRSTFKKSTSVADSVALRSKVDILYKLGAEPKEGWIAYQQFLIQQCSNSEYDDGKAVVGETIVQFEIDMNGQPTNFHFEKSINEEVNDGVENLIINGPEWKYTEHNAIPGIIRIKITF